MHIKIFVENNIGLIDHNQFDSLYERALNYLLEYDDPDNEYTFIGELTSLLLQANIDPLLYMTKLPTGYGHSVREFVEFKIPSNITSIGTEAFCGWSKLEHIIIPISINYMDRAAFLGISSSIEKITYEGTIDELYKIKMEDSWREIREATNLNFINCKDGLLDLWDGVNSAYQQY